MPKRSVRGITLFVGSAAETQTEKDFRDDELKDPVAPVELLKSPIVHVGSDVFAFILQNWHQSFEHHVQSFSSLLNNTLANPDDDEARAALDLYSLFQSTPKIFRRFRCSPRLEQLFDLQPRFNVAHVPSHEDQVRILAILNINQNGAESHSALHRFLGDPPVDPQEWLPEFHRFFKWFLQIMVEEVKQLKNLRVSKLVPAVLPGSVIDRTYNNLAVLKFFSWESGFFAAYISVAFATGISDPDNIAADGVTVGLASELEEAVLLGSPPEMSEESQTEEVEDNMGLDISTEFETGEAQASVTATLDDTHPCIIELRLISSHIQQLDTLVSRAPRSRFRFQVIQYAPSGYLLMPWRDLILELFPKQDLVPKQDLGKDIIQALADTPGKQFNYFRPGGPVFKFRGHAQCEAVLGCLFSLSKRGEDNTWTSIPQSILHAIGTCYSLLAPSKRCCPVCATMISFLSEEAAEAGGMGIHALSQHSVTFPCALPVGLPSSVRHKLLDKYRHDLRGRLIALLGQRRRLSAGPGATLSLNGDSEITLTAHQKRLLRMYQSGWATLNEAARKERWEVASGDLAVEQLMTWWAEMSDDMKTGLLPPGLVEKSASVPEMANLALISSVVQL